MNINWEKIKQKLNLYKDKIIHWSQDNRSYIILSGLIILFAIFGYTFYTNIIRPIIKKEVPGPTSFETITSPSDIVIIKDTLEEKNSQTSTQTETPSTSPSSTSAPKVSGTSASPAGDASPQTQEIQQSSTSSSPIEKSDAQTQPESEVASITQANIEENLNLVTLAPLNGSYVAGNTIQLAFTTNTPVKASIKSISLDGKTQNCNIEDGFSTSHILPVKVNNSKRIDIILHIESVNNQQKDILLTYNKH